MVFPLENPALESDSSCWTGVHPTVPLPALITSGFYHLLGLSFPAQVKVKVENMLAATEEPLVLFKTRLLIFLLGDQDFLEMSGEMWKCFCKQALEDSPSFLRCLLVITPSFLFQRKLSLVKVVLNRRRAERKLRDEESS